MVSTAAVTATIATATGDGRPAGPNASTAVAAPSSTAPASQEPPRPSRCGRPRTPVRRSSARSGSTLTKWAPPPSAAAAATSHQGGSGAPGRPSTTNAANDPNETRYGTGDATVTFNGQLYASPLARATVATIAAGQPESSANPTVTGPATSAPSPTVCLLICPEAIGLSARPATLSRAASSQSLLQPTQSWLARAANPAAVAPAGPRPTTAASSTVARVTAAAGSFLQQGVEDIGFLTLTYPREVICHVHTSWLNPRKVRQLTIVGDHKMAVWDDMNNLEPIRYYDKGVTADHYSSFGEFHMILRDGAITIPKVKLSEPLLAQDQEFIACLRQGRRPAASGEFATEVVRAVEAALESVRQQGRAVKLGPA